MIFCVGMCVSFLAGILFSILGLSFIVKDRKLNKNGILIYGYINNLVASSGCSFGDTMTDYNSDSKYVYVTYVYNGVQYLKNVLYYKKGMKVGDRLELLCNPNNPEQVVVKGTTSLSYMFFSLGIMGILMGLFMAYLSISSII